MRAQRTITTTVAVATLAFLAMLGTGPHTVQRGETLAGIASRYGTTTAALAQANGITNPNRILVGSRLTIPGAAPAAATTYTVQRGDTLGSIASRAGTSIATLVQLNGLRNPNIVRVGQVLSLPGAAAPTGTATPAGGAQQHVVRAGDTISNVAARYGIPQSQLIEANGLTGGVIYVGQRLSLVPQNAAPAPAPASGSTTHTVAAGQTLSSIAQRYGTTVRAIQDANGITDPNRVYAGRVLTIPSSSAGSSALRCPVDGPVRFMNDWGFPRSGGRFHEGNDLFAARGTPAVAVIGGTAVQKTGTLGGYQVKLFGDDGNSYYYTHLDRFGAAGRVTAGTVIGYVGSSGNAAGGPPHVHFELHPGSGAAVNPFPVLAPIC
jgi:LysM repeat protein